MQLYPKSKSQGKGNMTYITWEEDEDSSSSTLSSYEEIDNICLTMWHKQKYLDVSDSQFHFLPSYNDLSYMFHEMYVYALKYFKKISTQKKIFWN